MTTTTPEGASAAGPAQARYRGLGAAFGVSGLGLLLAQLDGIARTVGVLLLVLAVAAQLGADAVARVLSALPPVLHELPRPGTHEGPQCGAAPPEGPGRPGRPTGYRPRGKER